MFIGTPFLLGLFLVLTEQLRWLPSPWPIAANKVLFGILFGMSSVCCVIFGLLSAFQVYYLRRNQAALAGLDDMTILRRGIFTPATSLPLSGLGRGWVSTPLGATERQW